MRCLLSASNTGYAALVPARRGGIGLPRRRACLDHLLAVGPHAGDPAARRLRGGGCRGVSPGRRRGASGDRGERLDRALAGHDGTLPGVRAGNVAAGRPAAAPAVGGRVAGRPPGHRRRLRRGGRLLRLDGPAAAAAGAAAARRRMGGRGARSDGRAFPWGDVFDAERCACADGGMGRTAPVDAHPGGASPCGAGNGGQRVGVGRRPAEDGWRTVRGGWYLDDRVGATGRRVLPADPARATPPPASGSPSTHPRPPRGGR